MSLARIVSAAMLALVVFAAPAPVDAARLWSSGLELNSITDGVEMSGGGNTRSISSTQAHAGTYALRSNPTASDGYEYIDFSSPVLGSAVTAYTRFYLYIATTPAAGTTIFEYTDNGNFTVCGLFLNSDRTLQLYIFGNSGDPTTAAGLVGSPSSALSTNTWYRIEVSCARTSGGNPTDAAARIDGTQFASGSKTVNGSNGISRAVFGMGQNWGGVFNTTGDLYFDDIAINDTSGSAQTSWPGTGSIVHLRPSAAGDNAANSGTFANIDEVTPNDATGSDYIQLTTDGTVNAEYNMDDSTAAAIDSYDTVTLVEAHARRAGAAAGSTNYLKRLKSASGGTTSTTAADTFNSTSWATDPVSTTGFLLRLVSYTDPTTAVAWTPTGTNSLDNMQVGVGTTDGSPDVWVTALWALVEYVDGNAPAAQAALLQRGLRVSNGLLKIVNGGLRIY